MYLAASSYCAKCQGSIKHASQLALIFRGRVYCQSVLLCKFLSLWWVYMGLQMQDFWHVFEGRTSQIGNLSVPSPSTAWRHCYISTQKLSSWDCHHKCNNSCLTLVRSLSTISQATWKCGNFSKRTFNCLFFACIDEEVSCELVLALWAMLYWDFGRLIYMAVYVYIHFVCWNL